MESKKANISPVPIWFFNLNNSDGANIPEPILWFLVGMYTGMFSLLIILLWSNTFGSETIFDKINDLPILYQILSIFITGLLGYLAYLIKEFIKNKCNKN